MPRTLPNGRLYCLELARTEQEQDSCAGDLEDAFLASETDKAVALANILRAVERIKLARTPCRFFDFACRSRARELERRTEGD